MRIVAVARHVLPILATLQAPAATAQTAHKPVAKPDDVVVVGRNNRDPGTQIRDFVQIMTPTLGNEPLPRFDLEQLCPRALGLAPEFDEAITSRMHHVAAAVGIDLAQVDCGRVNALVIFADDKAAVIKLLKKR